jgi:glucosyl-3-phosphoglycerate synthase
MNPDAERWFAANTSTAPDWPLSQLLAVKAAHRHYVSVVIPARDEQACIGDVISRIRAELMDAVPLVDELVVIDSLSADDTAAVARDHGATVHSVADIRPELGVRPGKGEALWKSQFVTTGDLLVFIDADLTEWGPHFVSGLLGPLLTDDNVHLVRGFYDRLLDISPDTRSTEGGRVTELVARPLIAAFWPELAAVVQPLAGEWAIRRSLFATLPVPHGYGVEMSTLLDTYARHGLSAIAQVDLGQRAHRHQTVHDLAAMALQIIAVADRRRTDHPAAPSITLPHYERDLTGGWRTREVDVDERPAWALIQ